MGWSVMVEPLSGNMEEISQRWWQGVDISPLTPSNTNIHNYSDSPHFAGGHQQKPFWDPFSYACAPNAAAFAVANDHGHPVTQQQNAQEYAWSAYNEAQASLTPISIKTEIKSCKSSPSTNSRFVSSTGNLSDFEHLNLASKPASTDVDALMRVIQVQSPPSDPDVQKVDKVKKRYGCNIPGCGKSFPQRTHLEVHMRAHSGAKPHACKFPGCSKAFSQLGNLKTHERSHTGERPFQCKICKRCFAQKGNLRAHKSVHERATLYPCKLDHCGKQFTQLGNLKAHQNRFHADTLHELALRFSDPHVQNHSSQADRELFEYFASLYKHSNRGIKGRGKDAKTGPSHASPVDTEYSLYEGGGQERDGKVPPNTMWASGVESFPRGEGEVIAGGNHLGGLYEETRKAFVIDEEAFENFIGMGAQG